MKKFFLNIAINFLFFKLNLIIGVLWEETKVIEGSPQAVNHLKAGGKKFFYVTNNNGKTRADLVDKCKGLNYSATIVSFLLFFTKN